MAPFRYIDYATAVVLAAVTVALGGCSNDRQRPAKNSAAAVDASSNSQADQGDAPPKGAITITVVDKEGYQKAIESHRGKVVLVDYWATWCGPCVKQFPHTVELWKKYRDQGLDVIALSCDEPGSIEDVRKFLEEKGATFDNLISKVGLDGSADEFEFDGALPHYVVYDREGNLVKRLSPSDLTVKFSPALIDEAVVEQLAAKAVP